MDREALDSIISEFSKLTADKDCMFLPYKSLNFLVIRHGSNRYQICPEYPSQFVALSEHEQIANYFSRMNIDFTPNERGGMLCGNFNMVGDDDINETNDYDGKDGNDTYDRDSDEDEGKYEGKFDHK